MIMSMDRAEKTRQQPRQGSSLRPRPIGRDRAVLSLGRACQFYALACPARGAHEFARPLARPQGSRCMRDCSSGSSSPGPCGNRRLRSANRTIWDVTADRVTRGRAHDKRHGAKGTLLGAAAYVSTSARGILVATPSRRAKEAQASVEPGFKSALKLRRVSMKSRIG